MIDPDVPLHAFAFKTFSLTFGPCNLDSALMTAAGRVALHQRQGFRDLGRNRPDEGRDGKNNDRRQNEYPDRSPGPSEFLQIHSEKGRADIYRDEEESKNRDWESSSVISGAALGFGLTEFSTPALLQCSPSLLDRSARFLDTQ